MKTDKVCAKILAQLHAAGFLPEVRAADVDALALRRLALRRLVLRRLVLRRLVLRRLVLRRLVLRRLVLRRLVSERVAVLRPIRRAKRRVHGRAARQSDPGIHRAPVRQGRAAPAGEGTAAQDRA